MIDAHRVLVNGAIADKASRLVGIRRRRRASPANRARFVSRGGDKLDAALDHVRPRRRRASTPSTPARRPAGSPTACCSAALARWWRSMSVTASCIPKIRDDPRVTVIERFNVRDLTADRLPTVPALVVADLSFISLTKVIAVLAEIVVPGGDLVLLVKPQFEAGRREVARGARRHRRPAVHERVRGEVEMALTGARLHGAWAGATRRSPAPTATASSWCTRPRIGPTP